MARLARIRSVKNFTFLSDGWLRPHGLEARIQVGSCVFVRYSGRWEFYKVHTKGPSKGLERFISYVKGDDARAMLDSIAAKVAYTEPTGNTASLRRLAAEAAQGKVLTFEGMRRIGQ